MKNKALLFLAVLALSLSAFAHEDDYAKKVTGPNGGRILTGSEPRAEFFVMPDRKVQITFLDKDGQAVAPTSQSVVVTAGDRSAPTTLSFVQAGTVLISNAALPAGNDFPTVVQIKSAPAAKAVTSKFNLNVEKCGECGHAEYACVCH